MEENTNTVLEANEQPQQAPQLVKILAIFTYIFSALGILGGILAMVASGFFLSKVGDYGLGFSGAATGIAIAVGIVIIVFQIMTIAGAARMSKGRKSGFILWIIPNILLLISYLFAIYSLIVAADAFGVAAGGTTTILGFIITLLMAIGYATQLKKLN